jgi:hypothetical protein
MPVERRGRSSPLNLGQLGYTPGGARNFSGRRQSSCDGTSRMMREYQVRICEGLGVKFPGPTRQSETSQHVSDGGSCRRKQPWRPPAYAGLGGDTGQHHRDLGVGTPPLRRGGLIRTTGAGRIVQAKAPTSANRDWGQHQGSKQASQHIAWTVVAANANKDAAFRCGELDTAGFESLLGRRLRFFRDRAVSLRLIHSGRHRSISRACEPVHT